MEFKHVSVLLNESIEGLNIKKNGIYVDGTLGGAGHSSKICENLSSDGTLIGIDQDLEAIEVAKSRLSKYECKKHIVHDNFINIDKILDELKIEKVDGILLDIGVSSYQLDAKERGFSYVKDAKIDMRMDKTKDLTAGNIVNEYEEKDLIKILEEYGEERFARSIARRIIEFRKIKSIETTSELVNVIDKAIPKSKRERNGHFARRTFQALRIETNDELSILEESIGKCIRRLNEKGRLCIITFHSLEDRIVKNSFKYYESSCICPKKIPFCVCDKKKEIIIINKKPIIPSEDELKENERAHSAKLRIAEKLLT